MPKFTLVCDHSCDLDTHVVTHTFTAEHLDEVVMNMQEFLRGAGYYFDGELMVCDCNEPAQQPSCHSPYYYDIGRNK